MSEQHEYEVVNESTIRLKVPGGWIYTPSMRCNESWAVFVPDHKNIRHHDRIKE